MKKKGEKLEVRSEKGGQDESFSVQNSQFLIPRLRFPEFREAEGWEEQKLGDLVEIRSGNSPSRYQLEPTGAHPFVKVEDMNSCVKYQTAAREYSNESDGLIPRQSLIFPKRGAAIELNKVRLSARELLMDTNMMALTPIGDCRSEFLFYYISHVGLSQIADSSTIPQINNKHIIPLELGFPSTAEQQKIAECLSSIDEAIAAQARKLDALKTHKKGLMQQLFPREGETQPRLRFPEFQNAGEWHLKRLSSEIDLISGLHLSPEQYGAAGEVPYFTGPSDFTNEIQRATKWTKRSSNISKPGDTLITVKGSGVGEVWYSTLQAVALGRQLMAVRVKGGSSRFVFQFLLTKKTRFEDLGSGNLIPGLSRSDILEIEAHFPPPAEQQRIADCLTTLDNLITAETQKLEALKTHKRGLMQQLFPSPEEVKA